MKTSEIECTAIMIILGDSMYVNTRLDTQKIQSPGGKVDPEDMGCYRTAMARELLEEMGVELDPLNFKALFNTITPLNEVNWRTHWFTIELDKELTLPANPEPHKHTDWELVKIADLVPEELFGTFPVALDFYKRGLELEHYKQHCN